MTTMFSLRIWDEAASDTMLVDDFGKVLDSHGSAITAGRSHDAAQAAWFALVDGEGAEEAAKAAIKEWSDGYEGDPRNIQATITRKD